MCDLHDKNLTIYPKMWLYSISDHLLDGHRKRAYQIGIGISKGRRGSGGGSVVKYK